MARGILKMRVGAGREDRESGDVLSLSEIADIRGPVHKALLVLGFVAASLLPAALSGCDENGEMAGDVGVVDAYGGDGFGDGGEGGDFPPDEGPDISNTPLQLLEDCPSLDRIRNEYLSQQFTYDIDVSRIRTGYEVLMELFVENDFDPSSDEAEQTVALVLDQYEFLHPGYRIFLINLAVGLYAEHHDLFPWSLKDYSLEEIDRLFILNNTVDVSDRGHIELAKPALPDNVPQDDILHHAYPFDNKMIEDAHLKQFRLALKLVEGAENQMEAMEKLVIWVHQNFFHAYWEMNEDEHWGWEHYLDGREPLTDGPEAYPRNLDRVYEERIVGCHLPTIMLEGMAHNLNIPAMRLHVFRHGALYLPSLDSYIHGDPIASGAAYEPESMILHRDLFAELLMLEENVFWRRIFELRREISELPDLFVLPLARRDEVLYISETTYRDGENGGNSCIEVSDETWQSLRERLVEFNLQYDSDPESCQLTSDDVPIRTLEELSE